MHEDDENGTCTHCHNEFQFALMWLAFHEGNDYLLCNSCYHALGKPFSASDYVALTALPTKITPDLATSREKIGACPGCYLPEQCTTCYPRRSP